MAFCEVSDLDVYCEAPYSLRENDATPGPIRTKCFRCGQPACKVDSFVVRNSNSIGGRHPDRIRICVDCLPQEPKDIRDTAHNLRMRAVGAPASEMVAV